MILISNTLLTSLKSKLFFVLFFSFFILKGYSEVKVDEFNIPLFTKNEEKIEKIKKRLSNVEKTKNEIDQKYDDLQKKLFKEQVFFVEKRLKSYKRMEKKMKKNNEWNDFLKKDLDSLFLTDRKMLTEMIHRPLQNEFKEKTEALLYNILNIITDLKENQISKK
jgi:hypothetical protein